MSMSADFKGFAKGVTVEGPTGNLNFVSSPTQSLAVIAIETPNSWNEAVGMGGILAGVAEMNSVFGGQGTIAQHASVLNSLIPGFTSNQVVISAIAGADQLLGQKITLTNALPVLTSIASSAGLIPSSIGALFPTVESIIQTLIKKV